MTKRMKREEYIHRVQQLHGNNLEIMTEFKRTLEPISYRCNVCGCVREIKRAGELISKKMKIENIVAAIVFGRKIIGFEVKKRNKKS